MDIKFNDLIYKSVQYASRFVSEVPDEMVTTAYLRAETIRILRYENSLLEKGLDKTYGRVIDYVKDQMPYTSKIIKCNSKYRSLEERANDIVWN